MNPLITQTIHTMQGNPEIINDGNSAFYTWNPKAITIEIPKDSIHIYYSEEDEARRESYRTGMPFFISIIGGVRVYSVRVKL